MKVLISEDQAQFQTLMKMMMHKWGYEHYHARAHIISKTFQDLRALDD